jgi:hypothetical protein
MDEELKTHLEGMESRLVEKMRDMQTAMEQRVVEKMRDMQTELLRGFEAFSSGQTVKLRKLQADHSNLDTASDLRMNAVEDRLKQIELRLGLAS